MTLPVSKNDPRGILDDAWQEGHCTGYRAARDKFEHPIYLQELAIIGASLGIGFGCATGFIWFISPLLT